MFPSGARWSYSIRNECVQTRIERLDELHDARPGLFLAIGCRGQYSDQSGICSVPRDRIKREPRLSAVLARDDASMGLIPVENQILRSPLLHQKLIHNNRGGS